MDKKKRDEEKDRKENKGNRLKVRNYHRERHTDSERQTY